MLSNNSNIILLRQDKGRDTVVIDRKKYTEKCMDMLNTRQFRKFDKDPTKTIEVKIQRAVRKIKEHYQHLNIEHSILVDKHPANFMEQPRNIKSQ